MASVYILYSASADKFYIGSTKDLQQRFEYHLLKEFSDSYTAKYKDWELGRTKSQYSLTKPELLDHYLKNKYGIKDLSAYIIGLEDTELLGHDTINIAS